MRFIIVGLIGLFLIGCGGLNEYTCYQSVCNTFPKAEIVHIDNHKFEWIVRDTIGDVYYIACNSINSSDITVKQLIFKASKIK